MTALTSDDTTAVLSLRIESGLFDRLHEHAAKRGMSVQDYVIRALVRDDFDERFRASVDETERLHGSPASPAQPPRPGRPAHPADAAGQAVPGRAVT